MATKTDVASVVHVSGPVEVESVGTKRVRRQRCLRCDMLMRDERERKPFWLLGQQVAIQVDGWTRLIERAVLRDSEDPCVPTPFIAL